MEIPAEVGGGDALFAQVVIQACTEGQAGEAIHGGLDLAVGAHVAFVTGTGLTADVVQEHCARRLARFKRPDRVLVVDALPRGTTGKVQKGLLRRRLAEMDESQAGGR